MKKQSSFFLIGVILIVSFVNLNKVEQASSFMKQFIEFKQKFNKIYENEAQQTYRLSIFCQNYNQILVHNNMKEKSYQTGINQFTDLTATQFKQRYLTLLAQQNSLRKQQTIQLETTNNIQADNVINWVEKGYVTNVKDQGQCGACWAFATVGPIQALNVIKGGKLTSFSPQQLLDCSGNYGNHGCSGGLMTNSFKYIKQSGLCTQQQYPYSGLNQKCLTYGGSFKISGFVQIQDCSSLSRELMNIPIGVGVDASKFYSYKSGIFTCASIGLNHAITLVGQTKDYWLGKEQWGVNWGENGYIRISKLGTACGVCQMASYPLGI